MDIDPNVLNNLLNIVLSVAANGLTSLIAKSHHEIESLLVGKKNLEKQKLGEQSRVVKSVEFLEESHDSEASKALVHEAVVAAKADQDPDLQQAAQAVLAQVRAQPGGAHYIQNVTGDYNASAQGGGDATVNVNAPREP